MTLTKRDLVNASARQGGVTVLVVVFHRLKPN
jgi:hypothetical protein